MLQKLEQECFGNGTRTSTTEDNNAVGYPPIGRTFCHDKICNLNPPLTKVWIIQELKILEETCQYDYIRSADDSLMQCTSSKRLILKQGEEKKFQRPCETVTKCDSRSGPLCYYSLCHILYTTASINCSPQVYIVHVYISSSSVGTKFCINLMRKCKFIFFYTYA